MKLNVKANAFCPDNCIYCKYDFKMVEEGYYPVCKLKNLCGCIYDMAFKNGYNSAYNETLDALLKEDQCCSKPEAKDNE